MKRKHKTVDFRNILRLGSLIFAEELVKGKDYVCTAKKGG